MMAEIGVMEDPQIFRLIYLPAGREQLQTQVAFFHPI
jgi:hypothetical protein